VICGQCKESLAKTEGLETTSQKSYHLYTWNIPISFFQQLSMTHTFKVFVQLLNFPTLLGVETFAFWRCSLDECFTSRKRFRCFFHCQKLKNDTKNAFNSETHIQTAHPKRKCNRPFSQGELVTLSSNCYKFSLL
jgi:hypothetical protein